MSRILLITSSPRLDSHSTKVGRSLAGRLASNAPNSTVTHRDLTREPLRHIEVIAIEGVAFGPDAADRAVRGALDKVAAIAA